jgi:hypothetical protein
LNGRRSADTNHRDSASDDASTNLSAWIGRVIPAAADRLRSLRGSAPLDEVCFGYRCVTLVDVNALSDAQIGYAISPQGEDLTGHAPGDWRVEWLVIGTDDEVGDPIFVDTSVEEWPAFTAPHGTGAWEPERIADSFVGFLHALRIISDLASGRENPVALERNPLPLRQRERALGEIRKRNPEAEPAYWEGWLEPA